MNKPREHAELIKAWADGAEIESKHSDGVWRTAHSPMWVAGYEYRIKPEPKPEEQREKTILAEALIRKMERRRIKDLLLAMHNNAKSQHSFYLHAVMEITRRLGDGEEA